MQGNLRYKPVFEFPYIIHRTLDNKTGKFDIWSEPIVLIGVSHNDMNLIREIRQAFKNPKTELGSQNFGFKEVEFQTGCMFFCKQFASERTQVRFCMPAGTVLETYNL